MISGKDQTINLEAPSGSQKVTLVAGKEVGLSPGTIDNYISEALKFIRSRLKNESLPVLLFFSLFFL